MHIDEAEWLEKMGLKITLIFAGKHKADGNPFEALPADVRATLQKSVDKAYSQFVDLVSRNRGLDSQSIRDTEARIYRSDDALEQQLVDAIKTPAEAVAAFLGELGGDDPFANEDEDMSTTPAPAAAAAAPAIDQAALQTAIATAVTAALPGAVASAIGAERERSSAIRGLEEAKGREGLASTLADQGMSVEQAKTILAAAPKTAEAAKINALDAAMSATEQPQVGADGSAKGPGEVVDKAAAILADQASATGRKIPAKA